MPPGARTPSPRRRPTNASTCRSGSITIRCTSSGTAATRFSASTTGRPIEMLGTNRPSMTSTCSRSASPRSTARTASVSEAKSAARMEGAIRMFGATVTGSPRARSFRSGLSAGPAQAPVGSRYRARPRGTDGRRPPLRGSPCRAGSPRPPSPATPMRFGITYVRPRSPRLTKQRDGFAVACGGRLLRDDRIGRIAVGADLGNTLQQEDVVLQPLSSSGPRTRR